MWVKAATRAKAEPLHRFLTHSELSRGHDTALCAGQAHRSWRHTRERQQQPDHGESCTLSLCSQQYCNLFDTRGDT